MKAQVANPGGVLAPDEIVGRDQITARLWRILERRSVYMTAERRMGKTSIVRDKMRQAPPLGVQFIYIDVSRAGTALQFVEKLLNECRLHFDTRTKAKWELTKFSRYLSGLEIKAGVGIKLPENLAPHWKDMLESLMSDLTKEASRPILALDELPLMLLAIKRNAPNGQGESEVMELLDTLRAARQTNLALRMIYTGSLGLHHVLTRLQDEGYQNDPTNDMTLVEVEPLTQENAIELCCRLLRGEAVCCENPEATALTLFNATDGMPFYIHHVIEKLSVEGLPANSSSVEAIVARYVNDMLDPWHLRYYDDRIGTHYEESLQPIARAILDQMAKTAEKPRTFEEIVDGLNPSQTRTDDETVRRAVRLLGMDHYLSRDAGGGYTFRYPFIARVWKALRS